MNKPHDNARYQNTQKLINRATNTVGLTQKAIAALCGVHQSVVSGWKAGTIVAKWRQIEPLIEEYGDVQAETECEVYCRIKNSSYIFDEATANFLLMTRNRMLIDKEKMSSEGEVKEMLTNSLNHRISVFEKITKAIEKKQNIKCDTIYEVYKFLDSFKGQEDKEYYYDYVLGKYVQTGLLSLAHRYDKEYVKINGAIVFDYTFTKRGKDRDDDYPWMKWSIVSRENGKFTWVVSTKKHIRSLVKIDETHQHATWLSEINENLDAEEVMEKATNFMMPPLYAGCVDRDVLLFSLVHSFTQNGIELKCVSTVS